MATVDLRDELPRADWSVGSAKKTSITVHWNGTPVPEDVGDMDVIFGDAYYHVSKDWSPAPGIQGGDGIMYHRLYGRDGTVYLTRDPVDILWHCGDAEGNETSEAWQVMSGKGQTATMAQLIAIARDLAADGRPTYPHRKWSPTQCPGDELALLVQNLKEDDEPVDAETKQAILDTAKYSRETFAKLNALGEALPVWLDRLGDERDVMTSGPDKTASKP